jgi:predicted RNase H-like HicB family nuclease
MKRYTVIIEPSENGFGAFSPDVPGCMAVGTSREETLHLFEEALQFHFEGLREAGQSIPEPRVDVHYVDVAA